METFSYKAVDASGKDVKGAIEAESKDAVSYTHLTLPTTSRV